MGENGCERSGWESDYVEGKLDVRVVRFGGCLAVFVKVMVNSDSNPDANCGVSRGSLQAAQRNTSSGEYFRWCVVSCSPRVQYRVLPQRQSLLLQGHYSDFQ